MTSALISQIESLGNVYFDVRVSSRETEYGVWFARFIVKRKDFNEDVGGIQCSGDNQQQALMALSTKAESYLSALPSPPPEWKRIELRTLLIDYRKFNNELTRILFWLENKRAAGTLTPEDLHEKYWKARETSVKGSIVFSTRLAQLSEKDRIDLMTSANYVYQDLNNPWSLDDVDNRAALFEFIVAPSKDVVAAHKAHLRRCTEGYMVLPPAEN